jgi:hypothetical protein
MVNQNRIENIKIELQDLIRLCSYLMDEVKDSPDEITETMLANIHGIHEHSGTIIELESKVEPIF